MTLRWIAAATFLGAAVRTVFEFVYKHLRKDVLATIKLWSRFLKKAAISSWWKTLFFYCWELFPCCLDLLIIAFYTGYRQGKQSLPLCLNPSWTVMFWNSAGKGEMMHGGNCQTDKQWAKSVMKWVWSLISNLSKLSVFERGVLWNFRN